MPLCFMCSNKFNLNSNLITHLNIFHDPKSLIEIGRASLFAPVFGNVFIEF